MEHNITKSQRDPCGDPRLTADWDNSDSCPDKDQRCLVADRVTTRGSGSQGCIFRSLQQAETLISTTFNPSLRWLFHNRGQDQEAEEEHFVVVHDLVSQSSARLLRLQQALMTVAPHWQLVGRAQVYVPGIRAEVGVLLLPSSPPLQGHYRTLWRLLEQRSLLLFIHEYTRRARLATVFVGRVSQLLEELLNRSYLHQTLSSWSSFTVSFGSLSHELWDHLNHWSCLFSKVQSDYYLRPLLVRQTGLLIKMKHSLDSLSLQALVLMEHYVRVILSAVAQTELDSVPLEVLKDMLAGTEVYNQAVEEQRALHNTTQLRTSVLQQAHHSTLGPGLPHSSDHHPAALTIKEVTLILAVHHAEAAAQQMLCWSSPQSCQVCLVHHNHEDYNSFVPPIIRCGTCKQRSDWSWEQLRYTFLMSSVLSMDQQPTLHLHFDKTTLENHHPLAKLTSVQLRPDNSKNNQNSHCQTHMCQYIFEAVDSAQPNVNRQSTLENTTSDISNHLLVCKQLCSSAKLLFQLLVSSNDLLVPPILHMYAPQGQTEQLQPNTTDRQHVDSDPLSTPVSNPADLLELGRISTRLSQEHHIQVYQLDWAGLEIPTRLEITGSLGTQKDPEREYAVGPKRTVIEPDCVQPCSVQWLDHGQSLLSADLFGEYHNLLWTLYSKALLLQLFLPPAGETTESINLQANHRGFQILHKISPSSKKDLLPLECRAMLEDFTLNLFGSTAHAQWDHVLCRGLGSALKDKSLTDLGPSVMSSSRMLSATMKHFLLLSPPLLLCLCCKPAKSSVSAGLSIHRHTVSLLLATVQLSTVWVFSKAYHFLSSWSLNRFLLITQGDLKELRESFQTIVDQIKSLVDLDSGHHSAFHDHSQLLLRHRVQELERAGTQLQVTCLTSESVTLSSLVLKTFANDCKKISREIFEQKMPSSVHWRHSYRTGFPSSPSEYVSLAAQTVIGQVLEGVAPLSDHAHVQALSITMTAFLEAWMEHILKHKIRFSVQGALQLKQDFDYIKDLIQSDRYGLSAELHQHLLSLQVFQQVDSAVFCLLQQPEAKPYLKTRTWKHFTHCCPTNNRDSTDEAVGSSITNLGYVEGEDLTPADPAVFVSNFPSVDPSIPGEPYLAPSLALDAAQQEWLNLRIHCSARRWKLPRLQCLSKSET
ncbi:uncharacterized protein ccdc142 isoform X2 [Echeneis naucrates]|uniref:uncharacterized protein ccdc142 isoform X2 n=1 Tax=Echeneis naucrates TaxID=173247 RepID=UPI0011143D87|nr:coiled-coil domain-containing protein 142 isoform X2 [Echeneis naucrates]